LYISDPKKGEYNPRHNPERPSRPLSPKTPSQKAGTAKVTKVSAINKIKIFFIPKNNLQNQKFKPSLAEERQR